MNCINCGNEIGTSKFCPSCGTAQQQQQPQGDYQNPQDNSQNPNYNQAPQDNSQNTNYSQAPQDNSQNPNYSQAPQDNSQNPNYSQTPQDNSQNLNYNQPPQGNYQNPNYNQPQQNNYQNPNYSQPPQKQKKPFYKQVWFIIIVIVVALVIILGIIGAVFYQTIAKLPEQIVVPIEDETVAPEIEWQEISFEDAFTLELPNDFELISGTDFDTYVSSDDAALVLGNVTDVTEDTTPDVIFDNFISGAFEDGTVSTNEAWQHGDISGRLFAGVSDDSLVNVGILFELNGTVYAVMMGSTPDVMEEMSDYVLDAIFESITPLTSTTPPVAEPSEPSEPTTPAETQMSPSQEQAIREAELYLQAMAFSRSGLIEQLEYEQYSTEDATFAVDNVTVDWFVQAEKSAQEYLELMPFSRGELLDQLLYEGFSQEEAEHGVNSTGL